MKIIERKYFSIPRDEGKAAFKFRITETENHSLQVESVHPYDETEYHWALKSAGSRSWQIIRNGQTVSTVGSFIKGKPAGEALTPQQIAYFLIKADEDAHLTPTKAI